MPHMPKSALRNLALATPVVSDVLRYKWKFLSRVSACRGVYTSYHDAKKAGARLASVEYNSRLINDPEIIGTPANMRRRDYPILFWLEQSLDENVKIFNLGGNAGAEYFTYRQFLRFPPGLRWLVFELPYAVEFGKKLTRTIDAPELAFTTRLEDGDGAEIVLACGSLQYLEDDLATILKRFDARPRRVFINRVPLYDGETFYSIQSVHNSVVPYRIQNRQDLVDSLTKIGYRLEDCWYEEHEIVIPFHPERTVQGFYGFYFVSNEIPQVEFRANARGAAQIFPTKVTQLFAGSPVIDAAQTVHDDVC
jgi:putative methyltransferase (TIGR04325 family)